MSAFDPKRTFDSVNCRIAKGSFDHFVGGSLQRQWHADAKRLRGAAAQTGQTYDRTRPMLQLHQKVLAKAPSTRDPKRT
jgi:hypothetical protein